MALSFPSSPTTGQTYTAGGRTWLWTGARWQSVQSAPASHKSSHATGGADALTPADIGAATAAQGIKADSALQASNLTPYRTSTEQDNLTIALSIAL